MNKKKYAYIGALGFLGIITTEFGVIGILPQIAEHYKITIDKAGILLSSFALVIALTGPLMTLFMSGFERKKIMIATMFMFLITGVVSSLSPPFWLLIFVRILPAFLQPVYIATALTIATSQGNDSNKNELMGIVFSGVAIAMVTTVPLATYLASIFTWEASFVIQAIVSLIALLFIYFGLPKIPVTVKKTIGSQIKILKKPTFIISTFANFFMISAWFTTYSYFAEYLNKAKNMDATMISIMMLIFGIIGVFANFYAGKMLNKSVSKTTFFFILGTVFIPLLLLFSDSNIWLIAIIIGIWGFLYSPTFLNASTYMISSAPEAMEFANSLATSFGNLGITVGTTVGGYIIITYGISYTPWFTLTFGLLAILMMGLRFLIERFTK